MADDSPNACEPLGADCALGAGAQRTLDLDCGIALPRIASWLADELVLPCDGEAYAFHQGECMCSVTLSRLENRTIGLLDLERTRLVATGDVPAVDAFEKLFTLRFMSAGG